MTKVCSLHNVEAVHKEGVSKTTGKPYSFWACPEKVNGGYCKAEIVDREGANPASQKEWDQMVSGYEETTQKNRSNRIERQHSQTTALMYFQVKGIKDFTDEELLEKINFFDQDINQ